MAVYTAEAVILRKVDYGEADRILTLFTRERGKVPAIAKAVRKPKSRMSGQLDVFAHGQMQLAEGRNMDVITQFQRIGDPRPLAQELVRSAAAAVVAEVADKVLEERHPQPDLFTIVVQALEHLAEAGTQARVECAGFLMRMLAELGYAPELARCARCGGSLGEVELGFSPLAGGVICASCNLGDGRGTPVTARAVKVLRVCASLDRDLLQRLRLDDQDQRVLEGLLSAQLEHQLDRQLKAVDFLHRVASPPPPDILSSPPHPE
ncbi:MAG: DNA repair protein RecO [Candidatus Dormibacteria bacterium]